MLSLLPLLDSEFSNVLKYINNRISIKLAYKHKLQQINYSKLNKDGLLTSYMMGVSGRKTQPPVVGLRFTTKSSVE